MKLKITGTALFIILLSLCIYFFIIADEKESVVISGHHKPAYGKELKNLLSEKHPLIEHKNALWNYMNKNIDQFTNAYGEPSRKDMSSYGYEWWIYNGKEDYIKIAVKENKIVSMYSNRSEIDFSPLTIGQGRQDIKEIYTFPDEINVSNMMFKLSDKALEERPIIAITEEVYAQLYFDTFTNKLAGIRFLNKEVLELLKPYELYYTGDIKEVTEPGREEWQEIEAGLEQQIFELTNEVREEFELNTLSWEEKASNAAKLHSQDMKEGNYFSHYSLNGNGLRERLIDSKVYYLSAGENIAAHYTDAIAVMHGWLNSEGHREAILKEEYTHLGVGVYQSYYTQNFLKK